MAAAVARIRHHGAGRQWLHRIAPSRAAPPLQMGGEARCELRMVHEQASLDVALLAALGGVGRAGDGSALVDDDALGKQAGQCIGLARTRVVVQS